MFKKLFGRKGRFQNSWMIIFSVALIVMGICETINPTSSDTVASIFSNIKIVFGLPIVILGAIGLISTIAILVLEHKKIGCQQPDFLQKQGTGNHFFCICPFKKRVAL